MGFLHWRSPAALILAAVAGLCLLLYLAAAFLAYGRPPQPLAFGTVQWLDEVGATVDSVERVGRIGSGRNAMRAKGEFYIVHARIIAPFGVRPTWSDSDAEVDTFAHNGATLPPMRFTVDERAQAVLDRITGRPGPRHEVRGAQQHEDLVFDLPRDVEQPAILFLPANDRSDPVGWILGPFIPPHRFNLRYD
ncbi:MAG TPA: hypothetical protein VFL13_00105 [Candidatus Baltobacteraceae bacterium]|nr:hypothetical protein [Candidatus Baltobacteraceae bacterium]